MKAKVNVNSKTRAIVYFAGMVVLLWALMFLLCIGFSKVGM